MRAPAFVLGYHGCDRRVGEAVLTGKGHLKRSGNDYDWLGSGIYLWENNAERAMQWAKLAKENPEITRARIHKPFVVVAIIDPGNCFDPSKRRALECIGIMEEAWALNRST